MKQVAHYIGKVTKLEQPPEVSYALLKNQSNGVVVLTTADSELFIKNNLIEGDDFEIKLFQSIDGSISSTIQKLTESPDFNI